MANGSPPGLPKGQVLNSFSGIIYQERGHLRNETTKSDHLKQVRGYPSGYGGLVKPYSAETVREIGSDANLREYRARMLALRNEIAGSRQRFSRIDAPPGKRSILKNTVRAITNGATESIRAGLLSLPRKTPDMNGAMQAPFRPNRPKGSGRYTAAELLAESKIKERKASLVLEHADYLHELAGEQYRHGPVARREEFNERLKVLQPRRDTLRDSIADLGKVKKNLADTQKRVSNLQDERQKRIADLEEKRTELAAKIVQSKRGIATTRRDSDKLNKQIQNPREQLEKTETLMWSRLSLHAAVKGFDVAPDETVLQEIRRHDELKNDINTKRGLVRSNSEKISSKYNALNQAIREQNAITSEIEKLRDDHGSAAQKIAQAMHLQTELELQYQASVKSLRQMLDSFDADSADIGEYQRSLNKRIANIRDQHDNGTADAGDATLSLAEKICTLLDAGVNEIRAQLDNEDSDLAKDLREADETVRHAKKLVDDLKTYVEQQQNAGMPDATAVAKKIEALDAFASQDGRSALQEQLHALFKRLSEQPAPTGDQLDNKTVFDLVYDAASDLTPDSALNTDPALAASVLEELAQPERTVRSLMEDGLSKEAQQLVQALAVLPRGMEVLKRIVARDDIATLAQGKSKSTEPTAEQTDRQLKLDAIQRTAALQTYLRAGNELSKFERYGMLNDSTQQLLNAARDAARKIYDNPAGALSEAERVAFSAVRNRLTHTGNGSHVRYVSDRLAKFADEWLTRGVERSNAPGGRIGQGNNTGVGKIKNLLPTTGKTPLNSKTLAAADRTATGYAARELAITGVRLDAGVTKTGNDLRRSVVALLKSGVPAGKMELLLVSVAAADVARDKIAVAAENGPGLRPEHCIVGGRISRQDIVKAVNSAVAKAFAAVNLGSGKDETASKEEVAAIAAAISNSVGTEMLKGFPGTDELVAVAKKAAAEAMWDIMAMPDAKSAFVSKLDIAGAIDAIAATEAPEDIEAVKAKLAQLADEAGLEPDGAEAAHIEEIAGKLAYPLPPTASMPLKAENLIQCDQALQECLPTAGLDEATTAIVKETAKSAEKLAHLIDTSAPPELKSVDDIYHYLLARIEQIEIPGRMRLTSGGVLGVSTKGISDTISNTKWIAGLAGVSPRLRLEGLAGRNAAFELVFSSIGMEIWIGTERKKSAAAGFGVGGTLGITEARGSASADKAVTVDSTQHEGVKFMIPRSRTGEYDEDEMRLEAKTLLHALFYGRPHNADAPDTDPPPEEVSGLPGPLAAILAACPHVSIAVLGKISDKYVKQESAGNAVFTSRGKITSGDRSAGAAFSFGGKNTRLDWREYNISEQTGRVNVERHNIAFGGQSALNSALGPSASVATVGQGVTNTIGVSLTGGSTSRQVKTEGADVKLRLAVHDGKIDPPYTRREFEHTTTAALRRNIEANRELWIQTGVELLFRKPEEKKIPIEERRRFAIRSVDAALKMCEEAERNPKDGKNLRHVFAETYRLRDGAASQLDGIRSKEALLDARIEKLKHHILSMKKSGSGAEHALKKTREALQEAMKEKAKLVDAQNAIYREDASWQPWKISATERTYETAQQGGDLLFKTGGTDNAETQRPVYFWPY